MSASAPKQSLPADQMRLLQLAFDRYHDAGEWPLVDEVQHALDTSGEDLDVVGIGARLDPVLGRVEPGYQGRVMLTLRGVSLCAGSDSDLQVALRVMKLALRYWLRDGPLAKLTSTDVPSELGSNGHLAHRVLDLIQWLPGIGGGSGQPDGSWSRQITRDIRRIRDVDTVDGLVDLSPLPYGSRAFMDAVASSHQPTAAEESRPTKRAQRHARLGGRWVLLSSLVEGGQAHTFMARDSRDNSEGWVLKRLKNPKRMGRFEREVGALVKLDSEHIPSIADFSLDEPAYLVTRYIGPDLTRLEGSPASVETLLDRFAQVVIAARDAHRAGIVHRDIKPDNVLVAPDGRTYLVDFGICADSSDGAVLTTTAEAFGNRAFSAPEAEPGAIGEISPAADVYSLGKLLYWMLTGGGMVVREAFDPAHFPAEQSLRDAVVPLLVNTVRADPEQRWTSEELLSHVEWAIARIEEHRLLGRRNLIVLTDGFGPDHEVDAGGSHSATTMPQGNPPGQYEVAEAFSTGDHRVDLVRVELYLVTRSGEGTGTVSVQRDDSGRPSGEVVASWPIRISPSDRGALLTLEPTGAVPLEAGQTYWVCLAAAGPDANIAWVSAAYNLMPRRSLFAERGFAEAWGPAVSESGPGHALRVLARLETREEQEAG